MIEMAAASGLPLVPEDQRNPRKTTSYGTGMLIADALDQGIRDIMIGIGGSATNDGGMGAMSALGIRFLDEEGRTLRGCGDDLAQTADIDMSGAHADVDLQTVGIYDTAVCHIHGVRRSVFSVGGHDKDWLWVNKWFCS